MADDLSETALPADSVGLLEGLVSTRSIRRYRPEPVPDDVLRAILFAASRAPSGSNRQPFRFVVLRDGPKARAAKALVAEGAHAAWGDKRASDGYDSGSGVHDRSPKSRMADTMQAYVEGFADVPVLILPCFLRYRRPNVTEGASIYPACQNLLLAARALGYGGVFTGWQHAVEDRLRSLLGIPDEVVICGTITLGRPRGGHGPVRRRPLGELVFEESWDSSPEWAVDPPGVAHTSAGPPKNRGRSAIPPAD
jgi:nitroreductase